MNSPSAQIPSVLASLLAAKSPTDQFHYLRKYLTSDASLISPIYNIPPSPRSRDDYISRALLFFRMWVRECDVKVRRWAWNEGKGVAFLEVEIVPVVRGVVGIRENLRGYLGWVGGERIAKWEVWERWRGWSVGGVVVLGLRKDVGGVWRVGKIEVLGQPVTLLESLCLNWAADIVYNFLWLSTSFSVTLGQTFDLWASPQFSAWEEFSALRRDVAALYISLSTVYFAILLTIWAYFTRPFWFSVAKVGHVYNWVRRDYVRIVIEQRPRLLVDEINDGRQYIIREKIPDMRVDEFRKAVAVVKDRVGEIDGLQAVKEAGD